MDAPELIANRYQVERELGAGAMGRVLLVTDTASGEELALKVILGEREAIGGSTVAAATLHGLGQGGTVPATGPGSLAQRSLLQFKQEFRLAAQLHHPNCCAVHDYGVLPDGSPYFTMEVVPGQGLDELLPLAEPRAREVLTQLLLALGYIHQLGYVHCDLKPANVRVTPEGVVKLMDYGLMEFAGRAAGSIRGTLPYICPEMVRRGPIDQRSDLYSLGCLAYELLTGRPPFVLEKPLEVLRAHVMQPPPALPRRILEADPGLVELTTKLLAKDPLERYQSASEALEALGAEPPARIGGTLLASPLTGRDPELFKLNKALAQLVAGRPGATVLVWGPPGIGKSRLLDEFRCLAQLEGVAVALGGCHEHKGEPFGPFITLFHQLVPIAREVAPDVLAREAPVLMRILPELGHGTQGRVQPAPELDTGKQEALRLQASLAALLGAIAAHTPLVLVLEDWHWTDPNSADLLSALRRTAPDARVLWLVTSRANELEGSPHLDLPLAALQGDGLQRLVAGMLGTDEIEPDFLRQLAELTQGNPFFVERVLEHLVQQGRLRRDHGRWQTALELGDGLPPTIRALLREKIDQLPAPAVRLARTLAVIGRAAPLDLLQRASGLADEDLLVAVHELGTAKLLGLDARGRYHFAQAQVPSTLYETLDDAERRALHATLFAVMDQALAGRSLDKLPADVLAELARHGLAGTRPPRVVGYVLAAGERHAKLYALAEAERLLAEGLALVEASPLGAQRLPHFAFLRALGEVKRQAGRYAEASVLLEAALKLALDRPRVTGPIPAEANTETLVSPRKLVRLLTSLAKCYQLTGDYEKAIAVAERSRLAGEACKDLPGASRAALTIARCRFYQGKAHEAVTDAEAALAYAAGGPEPGITGLAHAFLGYLYVATRPEELDAGVQHLEASLALLLTVGDRPGLNDSYNLLGNAESMLGNFAKALEAFGESRRVCLEIGFRVDEAIAVVNLAQTAAELADWPGALAYAREARALSEALNAPLPLGMALALEGAALAQLGPLGEAAELAARAVQLSRDQANRYLESLVLMQQVEILTLLGRFADAIVAVEALAKLMEETGNPECAGRLDAARAEICARQGLFGTAREHADKAIATAQTAGAKGQELAARVIQARIQALAGEWEAAQTLATNALSLADRLGCRGRQAELHGVLGEAALAKGTSAAPHYEAMLATASSPAQRAEALFGRAATGAPTAAADAQQAKELLEALTAGVAEDARHDYLAPRERRRICDGDYVAFGTPARKQSAPPMGLRFGGPPAL